LFEIVKLVSPSVVDVYDVGEEDATITLFAVDAAFDVSIVLSLIFTLSVPLRRTAKPLEAGIYKSYKLT